MSVETTKLKVRCPHCRNWTKWAENPVRPFCSERCRQSDLGNWATERYRIPDAEPPAEEGPKKAPTAHQDDDE
jgi:endogenous inhibitor of DNA gyrase (YacG/DUF329 family)